MKLTQLIQQGAAQLDHAQVAFGHGTLNAHDEATWLILWQLQMPLDTEISDETTVNASQVSACHNLIQQRIATRKPAAYLTQEAWLQGIPFYVDERSIVPRSFIAELIAEGAFDGWLKESSHQFLDLCTGNGSLAIICALAYPDVSVVGADISEDALEVAKINVAKHVPMRFVEKGGAVFHGKQLSCSFVFTCNKAFCVLAVAQMEQVAALWRIGRN